MGNKEAQPPPFSLAAHPAAEAHPAPPFLRSPPSTRPFPRPTLLARPSARGAHTPWLPQPRAAQRAAPGQRPSLGLSRASRPVGPALPFSFLCDSSTPFWAASQPTSPTFFPRGPAQPQGLARAHDRGGGAASSERPCPLACSCER
jgi:hypothetical protein